MPIWLGILLAFVGLLLGAALIFFVPFFKKQRDQNKANKIIREAEIKAEHIIKNAQLDGKQTINEMKNETDKEIKERKLEISAQENKLLQREQSIIANKKSQCFYKKILPFFNFCANIIFVLNI